MPNTALVGALPAMQRAHDALQAVIKQEHPGLEWEVWNTTDWQGGLRSPADTAQILRNRAADWAVAVRADPSLPSKTTLNEWRKVAPYGSSMHNFGAAIDPRVLKTPAGMSKLEALNIILDYADVVDLADGRKFNDANHLELKFYDPKGRVIPPGAGARAAAKAAWEKHSGTKIFTG